MLPEAFNLSMLLVRTDYTNDEAWTTVSAAATALYEEKGYPRMGASLHRVESPELADLTPDDLVRLERAGYLSALAVADARSMRDLTVLFVDLNEYNEQVGRNFRAIPEAVEPIVANLSIANMDFFEFADNVDADGIFRGFREE
jgi:hypothetical protein